MVFEAGRAPKLVNPSVPSFSCERGSELVVLAQPRPVSREPLPTPRPARTVRDYVRAENVRKSASLWNVFRTEPEGAWNALPVFELPFTRWQCVADAHIAGLSHAVAETPGKKRARREGATP